MTQEERDAKVALVKERIAKKRINTRYVSKNDCDGIISFQTLKKYGYIERYHDEKITVLELQEVVDLLNEMDGDACYYYDDCYPRIWAEFKIIDGKICMVEYEEAYRFVK